MAPFAVSIRKFFLALIEFDRPPCNHSGRKADKRWSRSEFVVSQESSACCNTLEACRDLQLSALAGASSCDAELAPTRLLRSEVSLG
jgi:hypothetical protein